MMYKCRNVGSGVLSSCQSNSNIKIAKTNDKKGYKLSLHLQSTWWAPNDEWIECRKLCEVCRSLPETDDDGEYISKLINTIVRSINTLYLIISYRLRE